MTFMKTIIRISLSRNVTLIQRPVYKKIWVHVLAKMVLCEE